MQRILYTVILALLAFSAWAQRYENCIDSIDRYAEKQNWEMAERMLLTALKQRPGEPTNFILLSNLGTVHRNMGRLNDALADYNNALAITPNAVTIIRNRALLYIDMDSTIRAYDDFERIMRLDGSDLDAKYFHGMLALGFGKFEQAQADFEEVLAADKNNIDAKRGVALLYKIRGDYPNAILMYSDVIKRENRQSNYLSRAECYLAVDQFQEAHADLVEAQKLDPANPDIYVIKASLADRQYRYDDAERFATEAIRLGADRESLKHFFRKRPK